MEVLEFSYKDKAEDFVIKASTNDISIPWRKFRARVTSPDKYCSYTSDVKGNLSLASYLQDEVTELIPISEEDKKACHPVFYETNVYTFSIYIHNVKPGSTPKIIHTNKSVGELFNVEKLGNMAIVTGQINYLNEPGRFSLCFEYISEQDKIAHKHNLDFDVVTPKLDMRNDISEITRDIKEEYDELLFRYLSLTFQQYAMGEEVNNLAIWLAIFKKVVSSYENAVRYILSRTHNRDVRRIEFNRPDKIKKWSPQTLEQFYSDYKTDKAKALRKEYGNPITESTYDTAENRFVKFTLESYSEKLRSIINKLEGEREDTVSKDEIDTLRGYISDLDSLRSASLFRTIGRYKGFRQASLVLQQRTGYAQVYRYWILLQKGLDLIDGSTAIGVLPVWKLYEVWCFIKIKHMLLSILGLDSKNKDDWKYIEDKSYKKIDLFSGSDVEDYIFITNPLTNDRIELGYQYDYRLSSPRNDVVSYTVPQKPDIVLNIYKAEGDMVLTYLFDAKYRVKGDDDPSAGGKFDEPIEDTINQMHRYRDALYYGSDHKHYSKEVIGGYILFPGRIREGDYQNMIDRNDYSNNMPWYLRSIHDVNIGAFPLLPNNPNDTTQRGLLLYSYLKTLLQNSSYTQIKDSIPQRGLVYKVAADDMILVGYYKDQNQLSKILANKLYYVRSGLRKGSIVLPAGFENASFILLYHDKDVALYKLKGQGARIYSPDNLRKLGFTIHSTDSNDFYLGFEMEENVETVSFHDKSYEIVRLRNGVNSYDKKPYFTTMGELLGA